jgi:hypothetical protein
MTQLALPPTLAGDDEPWRAAEWQRLWVATQGRPWRSMALVPADPDGPPDATLDIAMALARTGMRQVGTQIHVADATQLDIEGAREFVSQVRASANSGPVILALSSVIRNPVMVPLAQSADCALLCIVLGQTKSADAQRAVDEVGRQHFIGVFAAQASAKPR